MTPDILKLDITL